MFSFRQLFAKSAVTVFTHIVDSSDLSSHRIAKSFAYTMKQLRVVHSASGSVGIRISRDGEPLEELDFTMSNDEEIDVNLGCPAGSFVTFELGDPDCSVEVSCMTEIPGGFVS